MPGPPPRRAPAPTRARGRLPAVAGPPRGPPVARRRSPARQPGPRPRSLQRFPRRRRTGSGPRVLPSKAPYQLSPPTYTSPPAELLALPLAQEPCAYPIHHHSHPLHPFLTLPNPSSTFLYPLSQRITLWSHLPDPSLKSL